MGVSLGKLYHAAKHLYSDGIPIRLPKSKTTKARKQDAIKEVLGPFFHQTTYAQWLEGSRQIHVLYGYKTREQVCCIC